MKYWPSAVLAVALVGSLAHFHDKSKAVEAEIKKISQVAAKAELDAIRLRAELGKDLSDEDAMKLSSSERDAWIDRLPLASPSAPAASD